MPFLSVRGAKLEPVRVKARRSVPECLKVAALAAVVAVVLCGALLWGCAS